MLRLSHRYLGKLNEENKSSSCSGCVTADVLLLCCESLIAQQTSPPATGLNVGDDFSLTVTQCDQYLACLPFKTPPKQTELICA